MKCKHCLKSFKPKRAVQIFCNHKCCYSYRNALRSPGRQKICKSCSKEFADGSRVNNAKFCQKCYENRADYYKYGLSGEQTEKLRSITNCQICDGTDTLSIDHDHKTGKVRGVLCRKCNTSLGGFLDDPELLQKAIQYIRST